MNRIKKPEASIRNKGKHICNLFIWTFSVKKIVPPLRNSKTKNLITYQKGLYYQAYFSKRII